MKYISIHKLILTILSFSFSQDVKILHKLRTMKKIPLGNYQLLLQPLITDLVRQLTGEVCEIL